MSSLKTYTAIFGVLMAFSTVQFLIEKASADGWLFVPSLDIPYGIVFGALMIISAMKALAVAGWYMHLREEPRAISYMAVAGVIGVLALIAGAAYSIT